MSQRRGVAEDRLFERPQLRAGLDPDLFDQPPAPLAVALESIGLTPGAVQRQHQLTPQLLVERLGRDGSLKVGNQLVVASEHERHVDALGPGGAPLVVEPRRSRACVPLECEIGQRVAAPQSERLVVCPQRLVQLLPGDSRARRRSSATVTSV